MAIMSDALMTRGSISFRVVYSRVALFPRVPAQRLRQRARVSQNRR